MEQGVRPRGLNIPRSGRRHGLRQAITAGTPETNPRPAHLPNARNPGNLADADQHGTDEARRG